MNRSERRKLKARERMLPSFSKATRARYLKDIQDKEHKEAIKRKIAKQAAKAELRREALKNKA